MKRLKIFGFVLLFVVVFSSTLLEAKTCKEDTLEAENDALLFGSIDTSKAKCNLISVDFFKYPPLENKLKYFNIVVRSISTGSITTVYLSPTESNRVPIGY